MTHPGVRLRNERLATARNIKPAWPSAKDLATPFSILGNIRLHFFTWLNITLYNACCLILATQSQQYSVHNVYIANEHWKTWLDQENVMT